MENLQAALRQNYNRHPSFTFGDSPWLLDKSILDKFNNAHGNSRTRLDARQFQEILESLNSIRESLLAQCIDTYEKEFVKELFGECQKYIQNEFTFRKRLKPSKLQGKDTRATGLAVENLFFGNLSPETTRKIIKLANPLVNEFRLRASEGKLKRTDLSKDSGPAIRRLAKLVDKDFRAQGIFKIVSDFVGIDYNFTGLSLELSVAGSTWWKDTTGQKVPPQTMYAHLDESIYAPKSIVYLSKVESDNGPTSCYPGFYASLENSPVQDIIGRVIGLVGNSPSSKLREYYGKSYHQSVNSEGWRRHFMKLPPELRFNSHFGWDVVPSGQIEKDMVKIENVMLGDPGKFIVFDGSQLLHRGGLIEAGERVVMQVVFYPGTRFSHTLKVIGRMLKINRFRTGRK